MKPTPQQIEAGSKAAWRIFAPDDEWESRHFASQKFKTLDAVEAALIAALNVEQTVECIQCGEKVTFGACCPKCGKPTDE